MRKKADLSYWVLNDMYVNMNRPVDMIAKSLKVSVTTVYKYLKIYGLMGNEAPVTTKEHCKRCKYNGKIAGEIMCNYASITDELRNCSSEHCLRYEPKGSVKK